MAQQVSTPKGTRDFGPSEMNRRNYIFNTIKEVFHNYGFSQIETPAMENLSTLLGKYGAEGDKLLFKILNSGNFTDKISKESLEAQNYIEITNNISEKGLRYDLTVPFARFVVQHRNDIVFPFKRYQIQPVWRADKPQKGRYREFYQCDVDIIGSKSLLNEFELIQIIDDVFAKLGISVTLKLNNRKILSGIAEAIGEADKFVAITVAIDKIDKIGLEKVEDELRANGLSEDAIVKLRPILTNTEETFKLIESIIGNTETGKAGIEEMNVIFNYIRKHNLGINVELDLSLARGLNYYTGAIFEVKANDVEIGSICGGGRYDNLTGIFGMKDVSGVGVSFGADRIYDVLMQLDLFPKQTDEGCKALLINFGAEEESTCIEIAGKLRKQGISCVVFPEKSKLDKQFKFADSHNIPYVIIIGENEIANKTATIKNMATGEQNNIPQDEIMNMIKLCRKQF